MRSRRCLLGAFLLGLLSRANAGEEFGYETIDCPILWIAEREGNEREAVLAYGAEEGLLAGRRGALLSRYDKAWGRDHKEIGAAEIIAVEEHRARARITSFGKDVGQAGDLVQVRARVPRLPHRSILWTLARKAIVFSKLNRDEKHFTYAGLYRGETASTLDEFLRDAVEDIRGVAERAGALPVPEKGRYRGRRCTEILAAVTEKEVLDFLDYVASFPGKYMGDDLRLSEAFAGWVVSGAPLGGLQFLDRLRQMQDPAERAACLRGLAPEIEGSIVPDQMVGSWRARVDELSEMGRHDEAAAVATLAIEADKVLGLDRDLPQSLFRRAYALGEADRHTEARQAYAETIAALQALPERDDEAKSSLAFSVHNAAVEAWQLGLLEEALQGFRDAVPLYEAADAPEANIGRIHRSIGDVLRDLGRYEEAIEKYELAANIAALLHEHGMLQEALLRKAKVYAKMGASADATETYERVLEAFRRVNDRPGEARALLELAGYQRGLGGLRQAFDACARAEAVWRDVADAKELSATLVMRGRVCAELGDADAAELAFQEALRIRRDLRDRAGEAESLQELGALRVKNGDFRKGLETYEEARTICAASGDAARERAVLDRVVSLFWERREYEEALRRQDQLVTLWRGSGAQEDLAYAVLNRGALYGNLRDLGPAERDVSEALAIFRAIKRRPGEAEALEIAARHRAMAREWDEARRFTEEALAIFRETKNRSREGGAARQLGDLWGNEYRYAEAREWYDRAIAIFEGPEVNAPGEVAKTRMAYAGTLALEGDLEQALALRRGALDLAARCGDRLAAFGALMGIGEGLADLGLLAEARDAYDRAEKLAAEADGGEWLQGNLLWSRATLHKGMGEMAQALACNDAALALWRKLRNDWGEAAILHNRAQLFLSAGDMERALADLDAGFPIAERTRDQQLLAGYLSSRADACVERKDFAAAIPYLEQALALSRSIRHKPFIQGELVGLAKAQRKLAERDGSRERLDAAAAALDEALRLAREMESALTEATTLVEMGALALARGDTAKSRETLQEARALVEPIGARHLLAATLFELSRAEEAAGDLATAAGTRRASIAVYQEIRAALGGGDAAEERFLRSKIEVYESMASLLGKLIEAERDPKRKQQLIGEALGFVARARFELLGKDVSGTGSAEVDRLLDEIRKAEAELARLEEERSKALEAGNRDKADRIAKDIARKEEDLGRLYLQRKGADPDMHARLKFDPRRIDMSQAPPDARLLLYFPGDKGLQIWVFSSEGFLVWKEEPIARSDLYGLVARYGDRIHEMIRHLKQRDAMGMGFGPEAEASERNPAWYRENIRDLRSVLRELHGHLIASVAKELEGADLLLILPYGQLNYLPFEALVDEEGRFLGARKRFVYFANDENMSSTLDRLQRPADRREDLWVAYADPCGKLVDSLEEAGEIGKLFPRHEVHTQETKDATEGQLERTPAECTILHFATHGYLNRNGGGAGEVPEPFLELAKGPGNSREDDGRLEAGEVWPRLKRKVPCFRNRNLRLVVLSACDTARGQDDPQAEVLGLPDVFVTAGAPAVVASLWSVYSWTTTDLMVEFYRQVAAGSDLASALREARGALLSKKEGLYAHPFYWAPFLLFGDWR